MVRVEAPETISPFLIACPAARKVARRSTPLWL